MYTKNISFEPWAQLNQKSRLPYTFIKVIINSSTYCFVISFNKTNIIDPKSTSNYEYFAEFIYQQ